MLSIKSYGLEKLNRPLYFTSLIHVLFAILFAISLIFDERVLLGLPVWVKPLKFAVSLAVYTFTLAYLVQYVEHKILKNIIVYGTVIAAFVEMILIAIQAARGVKSHFHTESVLGVVIYEIMGIFIAIATILLIILTIYFLKNPRMQWTKAFQLSVQLGLWLTIFGCAIGGFMSAQSGHTVGALDGGEGLPLVNWSTQFGDWRVAHFLGLHAIQIFLLAGWVFQHRRRAEFLLWTLAILYVGVMTFVILLTINATSIISFF